ncbi:MAG: signal peptidase I [Lachnospiraceae bacterium]|nr:signal peptidase I [Lachnospiraceae bacterium]
MRQFFYIFHCLITLVILSCSIIAVLVLLPNVVGVKCFIVLSNSMEPSMSAGSIVYINMHVKAEEIEIGDLIAFEMQENRIVHRVTSVDRKYKNFTTKGDANKNEDLALVSYDDLLGRACGHIPHLGYFIAYIGTTKGLILVFTLFVLWITSGSLSKEKVTKGDMKYEKENS